MKASTILLLCATTIGAIAFHPSAASADIDFSTGNQGTSIRIGDPAPVYQHPIFIEQPAVIVQPNTPEWRHREEIRLREEHRLAERRQEEHRLAERRQEERRLAERRQEERRLAERRQEERRLAEERQRDQRFAQQRQRDQRFATQTSNSHVYNPNNHQQNNTSTNFHNYDHRDR